VKIGRGVSGLGGSKIALSIWLGPWLIHYKRASPSCNSGRHIELLM